MNNIFFLLQKQINDKSVKKSDDLSLEVIVEFLEELNNNFELLKFVFCLCFFIITIIVLFKLTKIVNKKSINEYQKNENNGKFIGDLYIELGDSSDKLRYMVNSKKWVKRIKSEFVGILKTNVGKMLRKKCNIKFYDLIFPKRLFLAIAKCKNELESRSDIESCDDRNFLYYLRYNGYYLKDDIMRLYESFDMINNNICFLLGKAGCGKTNMLTYLAKKIVCNYKQQCIYIDAKDVKDNEIESAFFSYFNFFSFINENKKWLINLILFLKRILNHRIIVIIEAINENANIEFCKNLCSFVNKYYKYKNIKIIISCRTEFYNYKFKNVFDEYLFNDVKYKFVFIEMLKIDRNILEKMYEKYKEYFNFNGTITKNVQEVLFDSPLLMRIFFERYSNSSDNVSDIDKSRIFSEYISMLSMKYKNLNAILSKIINYMIKENKYDFVYIDDIDVDFSDVENLIYEYVLLSKSIVDNEGEVNEEKREVISITYDEIRDYLITNEILKRYKKKEINIMEYINEMVNNKYPIVEGVIKNLYCFFKNNNQRLAKRILLINKLRNYNFATRDMFYNSHLDFIFSTKSKLEQYEIDYLNSLDYIDNHDLARMISVCTYNTINLLEPGIEFIVLKMEQYLLGNEKVFDFSCIRVDSYKKMIKNLNSITDENVVYYVNVLRKLVKYLEKKNENV